MALNFLQPQIPVSKGTTYIYPQFKINSSIFFSPHLSENYLNPLVSIHKMKNKHTVDYHPSPSQLTSRIYPLIFLWTPKGFISPESFLIFFLNLYITTVDVEKFQIYGVKITRKYICDSKNYSCSFLLVPQAKLSPRFLSLLPRQKEITHSSQTMFSEDLYFPSRKGRGL